MVILGWDDTPQLRNSEEAVLLVPLLDMLRRRGWISSTSILRSELPLNGRRVDLATMTSTGISSAYELKIGSFQRVLEQAMYNRISFDKSWVVVTHMPQDKNLNQAQENGIGIILLGERMTVVSRASRQKVSPVIRSKVMAIFNRGVT